MTSVTTNPGSLGSKQTAINPNFAAIVVHYLKRAGVSEGDTVAVGYSGSFPAINVAVLSAIEALELKAVIVSSASSSQWGANEPALLWLDMEKVLLDKNIISRGSIAASIGGIEDRGIGMSKRGVRILREAIERHGLPLIDPATFVDSVRERMRIYREEAGGEPIKVYINVGGGTISVGRKFGKRLFKPGLNRGIPPAGSDLTSVMSSFLEEDIPVVHFVKIVDLAERFGLTVQPQRLLPPGEGKIFIREEYNQWFALFLLFAILGALYLFVRSDLGFRMTRGSKGGGDKGHPEPMV
jgi:poly-gamma-glutamate system protein